MPTISRQHAGVCTRDAVTMCRCPLTTEVPAMTEPYHANLQLAIVLPLGVVANQLMRIEALDLIRGLTSDIEADMYPKPASMRPDSSQRED